MIKLIIPPYECILAGYVQTPLQHLGLIETRKASEWPGVSQKDTIRVTAAWRKFISFAAPA